MPPTEDSLAKIASWSSRALDAYLDLAAWPGAAVLDPRTQASLEARDGVLLQLFRKDADLHVRVWCEGWACGYAWSGEAAALVGVWMWVGRGEVGGRHRRSQSHRGLKTGAGGSRVPRVVRKRCALH